MKKLLAMFDNLVYGVLLLCTVFFSLGAVLVGCGVALVAMINAKLPTAAEIELFYSEGT